MTGVQGQTLESGIVTFCLLQWGTGTGVGWVKLRISWTLKGIAIFYYQGWDKLRIQICLPFLWWSYGLCVLPCAIPSITGMQVRESCPSTNAQLFYDTSSIRSQGSPVSLCRGWGRFGYNLRDFPHFLLTLTTLNWDTSLDWVESMTGTEIQVPPISI